MEKYPANRRRTVVKSSLRREFSGAVCRFLEAACTVSNCKCTVVSIETQDETLLPPHLSLSPPLPPSSLARSLPRSDFAAINEIEFRERGRRTCTFAIQIFGLPYRARSGRPAVISVAGFPERESGSARREISRGRGRKISTRLVCSRRNGGHNNRG